MKITKSILIALFALSIVAIACDAKKGNDENKDEAATDTVQQTLKQDATDLVDKAKSEAQDLKGKAGVMVEDAKNTSKEVKGKAGSKIDEAKADVKEMAKDAKKEIDKGVKKTEDAVSKLKK